MSRTVADAGGWPAILNQLVQGKDLESEVASAVMDEILAGVATPAQIGAFAIGLRAKGETVEEMAALVSSMVRVGERLELPDDIDAVDTCGTGGSTARRTSAFNVSTIASFVAAGAGVPVCKHGGRAASATSSSGDVLEHLGVVVDLGPAGVRRCVIEAGMGFCFAPRFNPAMRHAAPTRRELGIPTVFNFLGPLTNPAGVRRQVVGVSDPGMARNLLGVLRAKGARRALVVHGDDGLDELTIATTSTVYQLDDDQVRTFVVDPTDLGIPAVRGAVQGGDAAANAELVHRVLGGEAGPHRDIVVLNAAAACIAAGRVDHIADGFEMAAASIDSGAAAEVLTRLATVSQDAARSAAAAER